MTVRMIGVRCEVGAVCIFIIFLTPSSLGIMAVM